MKEQHNRDIHKESPLFQTLLLEEWVKRLGVVSADDERVPVINRGRFCELVTTAQKTKQPLIFVAIGCQDWVKTDFGNPESDRVLGRITEKNKRAQRFITELTSFSQALSSFSVPHQLHFSLSDVEALMHLHLRNMDLVIHNSDAIEVMGKNNQFLSNRLQQNGISATSFTHSQELLKRLQASSLSELQIALANSENVSLRKVMDGLYEFDLSQTAHSFVTENTVGPVWLDIQSFNFREEVSSFERAAQKAAPTLPILSLFPNAGNWHASPIPTATFTRKEDLLAQLIGSKHTPQNAQQWLSTLHKTRDEKLNEVFTFFGHEPMSITSGQEKSFAVRIFFELTFGFDPMLDQKKE